MIPVPPIWVCDTECYKDFFLVMFRNVYSGQTYRWELYDGAINPMYGADSFLRSISSVTFNASANNGISSGRIA